MLVIVVDRQAERQIEGQVILSVAGDQSRKTWHGMATKMPNSETRADEDEDYVITCEIQNLQAQQQSSGNKAGARL